MQNQRHASREAPHISRLKGILAAVALALIFCATPLLFRVPLITADGSPFAAADLSGVLRDGAFLGFCLWALGLIMRPFWAIGTGVLLLAVFVVLEAANAAFIRTFGHTLDVSQAGYLLDGTFFWGSAAKLQNPTAFALGLGAVGALAFLLRRMGDDLRPRAVFVAGLICGMGAVGLYQPRDVAPWQQTGILTQNTASLARAWHPAPVIGTTATDPAIANSLAADLSGTPQIPPPAAPPNILLVVLESVSSAYLPQVAQDQGLRSTIAMPQLEAFARKGAIWPQFFAHQRQTTRGTFALLCGQLPRFSAGLSRLEDIARSQSPQPCLPQVLAEAGYHTVYFQAAPLSFSQKDRALPLLGYRQLEGAAAFDAQDIGSAWGPDDGVFLDRAADRIAALNMRADPWFLTLLNVGTHHPFDIVPPGFDGHADDKVRAFEYLDVALGAFLSRLQNEGMLDNTVVILTSDESGGLEGRSGYALKELSRNLGLLAVVAPGLIAPAVQTTQQAQFDLPLSVTDLLGLPAPAGFGGRSIFRSYAAPRTLYAYNNIGNFSYALRGDRVDMCRDNGASCDRLQITDARLGSLTPLPGADTDAMQAQAQQIIAHTNAPAPLIDRPLAPRGTVIEVSAQDPYLICCQYIDLRAGDTFAFEASLHLVSDMAVRLHVDVVSQKDGVFRTHFAQELEATPGVPVHFGATLGGQEALASLELRLRVSSQEALAQGARPRFEVGETSFRVVR